MAERYDNRYLSTTQKDLIEIFDLIEKDYKNAAENLLNEIDKTIGNLSLYPEIGLIPKDYILKSKSHRYLIIGNYLIFYIFKQNYIEIHRILHSKRNFNGIL